MQSYKHVLTSKLVLFSARYLTNFMNERFYSALSVINGFGNAEDAQYRMKRLSEKDEFI
jgi:hypothetical protein